MSGHMLGLSMDADSKAVRVTEFFLIITSKKTNGLSESIVLMFLPGWRRVNTLILFLGGNS